MSSKTLMNTMLLLFILIWSVGLSNGECEFKAIFNFGDSNSDTGGFFSAFPAEGPPFGMTYFKKPVGRASDGRLVIDFLGNTKYISYDIIPNDCGHEAIIHRDILASAFSLFLLIKYLN